MITKKLYNIIKYGWFITYIVLLIATEYIVGYLTGSDIETSLIIVVEGVLLLIPDYFIAKWLKSTKKY